VVPGNPVPVIVLKTVVIIMVSFSVREESDDPVIFGRGLYVVRFFSEHVTDRVHAEGRVMHNGESCANAKNERAQELTLGKPDQERQRHSRDKGPEIIVIILMREKRILSEVPHIIEVERMLPEEQPSYVGVKETFSDAVGVQIRRHKTVMVAVLGTPPDRRLLKGARAKEGKEELDDRMCFIRTVGKKTMVAGANADTGGHQEKEEKPKEGGLKTIARKIERPPDQSYGRGRDEKEDIFRNDLSDRDFETIGAILRIVVIVRIHLNPRDFRSLLQTFSLL
jgi:hypothetical protein